MLRPSSVLKNCDGKKIDEDSKYWYRLQRTTALACAEDLAGVNIVVGHR
jgi:hypothetical protein